jgi:hypothetical protein
MPIGRFFGLPCRFPATPAIFAVCGGQAYDYMGFFAIGEAAKKLFPGFPCVAGKGKAGGARSARRGVLVLGMPVLIISPSSTL